MEQLREQGVTCSLETEVCRQTFSAEWFFARAVWLGVKAEGISDPELRQIFLAETDSAIAQLSELIPDLIKLRAVYFSMAMMFEEGQRDPNGLPYGPGPFILERYRKHIESIRRDFKLRKLMLTDQEAMAVMLLGDSLCWRLNDLLDATLQSMLTPPETHG